MVDTVYKIQHRRGTMEDWNSANPILGDGEIGVLSGTSLAKMGDGVKHWLELSYFNMDLSDATPAAPGTAAPGTSSEAARADHVHPGGGVTGDFVEIAGDTMTGNLKLQNPTGFSELSLDGVGATGYGALFFRRNDKLRWSLNTVNNTEPGDGTGSNLAVTSRNDDGSAKDTILIIPRKTGVTTFNKPAGFALSGNVPHHNLHAAALRSPSATETGYLLIKLPVNAVNAMGQYIVRGYNYESPGGGQWSMKIGAYATAASGWVTSRYNASAEGTFPGKKHRLPVRLLHKGTSSARELAIAIGDSTTPWGYPFAALEVIMGYSGFALALEAPYTMEFTADISAWTTAVTISPETPFVPSPGGYRYMSHANQNIAAGSDVKTTGWVAAGPDTGNGIISYSNGNFTMNESGLYDISWSFSYAPNTTGIRRTRFTINDGTYVTNTGPMDTTGYCTGVLAMQAVPIDAGDFLSFVANHTATATITIGGRATIRKVGDYA